MTKKVLSAEMRPNWTALAGALEGLLAFLGRPLDRPTLMGLSGHAFRLAITNGAGGIAAAGGTLRIDYDRALPLYANLGFTMRRAGFSPLQPDYDARRREALEQVHRSIDRGRPVIASRLQVPDFGIVNGYDDRAGLLYVSTAVSSQYGPSLPLTQWPPPTEPRPVEILLPGNRRPTESEDATLAALQFAVDYAVDGDPADPPDTAHGLAAYEYWLKGYTGDARLDSLGNARCLQTLQAARRDAAVFLHWTAASRSAPTVDALNAAATAYEEEALILSRMGTLFPFPGGGETENPQILSLGAAALRPALACERRAIACMRDALDTLRR